MPEYEEVLAMKRGSGNVFADIGLPDSDALLAKAELTSKIADVIEALDLTQSQVAERTGLPQPKVSSLLRGRFEGISMEKLFRILTALGRDVDIRTRVARNHPARLLVVS
jgi:predicted XRE-type DNA-binding protein